MIKNEIRLPKFYDNTRSQSLLTISNGDSAELFIVTEKLKASTLFEFDMDDSVLLFGEAPIEVMKLENNYLGLALMVSPDLGLTTASSLEILPGTFDEKLNTITG